MATFRVEAEEHVRGIISGMSQVEALLDEGSPIELKLVEPIYRQFHSLKGASQAIGFDEVGKTCQAAESILAVWKQNLASANRADISTIVSMAISAANQLNLTIPGISTEESGAASQAEETPAPPAVHPYLTQTQSEPVAARAEVSSPKPAEQANVDITSQLLKSVTSKRPDTSDNNPTSQVVTSATAALSTTGFRASTETIRIGLDKLDSLLRRGEQLVLARLNSQIRWTEGQDLLHTVTSMRKKMEESSFYETSMLNPEREELRRYTANLQRHVRNLAADHHELNNQLRALLNEVKSARLAPVRPLLEELEMAARRIARQLSKRVRIEVYGGELELDRSIIEALKDPLIHLVRNALDHGLEQAEERRTAGKPTEGHLKVEVCSQGTGTMEFRISDDGRGIQTHEVLEAARRQGLIADGVNVDSLDLIFSSGVSTRSQVSDLSGRGLGMAIVREKVENLKGSVRVQTKVGEGTTFILSMPTSLATFEGLLVKERERHLVFPLNGVEAVTQFYNTDIRSVEGSQVVSFRGALAPVSRLGQVLNIPAIPGAVQPDPVPAVIVSAGGRKAAFLVDGIFGAHEVLSRDLGPQLKKVRFIIGACMVGYQEVVPVLNIADLLTHIRGGHKVSTAGVGQHVPNILVVDDSITTRTLMRSLLESANYKVKVAVDGGQAWEMLQTEPVDLVVSDVDMPGITGFDLTVKMRSSAKLRHLPLILVTGQERDEDRQRGLKLGASSYILKSRFDEGILLESVERLVGEASSTNRR